MLAWFKRTWVKRTFWALLALAVLFYSVMFFTMNWHILDRDTSQKPPVFLEANFVVVDKLMQVSRFRSGVGHDASFDGETCRSMRHYFGFLGMKAGSAEEKLAYRYDNYAPVSGRVMGISGGYSKNGTSQINIRPDNPAASGYEVRIDNIVPSKGLHFLSHVTAGEKIGESLGMAEITIAYHYIFGDHGFSYFQVLPDNLFAEFQKAAGRPITREEFILTKEYRDAHPLQCEDSKGQFFIPSEETQNDQVNNVFLNGYVPNTDKAEDKKVQEKKEIK